MKQYLPIGSVVLLEESTKRVMIIGVKQREVGSETVWDYSGVYYPEGIIDPNKLFLFNREQIRSLFFIGFQDVEGLRFLQFINDPIDIE